VRVLLAIQGRCCSIIISEACVITRRFRAPSPPAHRPTCRVVGVSNKLVLSGIPNVRLQSDVWRYSFNASAARITERRAGNIGAGKISTTRLADCRLASRRSVAGIFASAKSIRPGPSTRLLMTAIIYHSGFTANGCFESSPKRWVLPIPSAGRLFDFQRCQKSLCCHRYDRLSTAES
jgi:hypothetical protein